MADSDWVGKRSALRRLRGHVSRFGSLFSRGNGKNGTWPPSPLSLALQGGGSFGAFTWGVLDRLLEERIEFDTVSGASAGAVNAVILAAGLAGGGHEGARAHLERFWKRVSQQGALISSSPTALQAIDLSTRFVSPYQFNPFNHNPLRALLDEEVDFARLQHAPPIKLLIGATRVRDGRAEIFSGAGVTLDAVVASACLPQLHHAVRIHDEWYWDGGFTANPPLLRLVKDSQARDAAVIRIVPIERENVPALAPDIARRVQQIVFNNPLALEMDALRLMTGLSRKRLLWRTPFERKLARLRLHLIAPEDDDVELGSASPITVDWGFLVKLKESGRRAAEKWVRHAPPSPRGR